MARTYYRFVADHTPDAEIMRFRAGSTSLDLWAIAGWTNGDRFTFRASGPASAVLLEVLKNGVVIRTFTDTSGIASGSPGMSYSTTETGMKIDSWEGGELVSDASGRRIGTLSATGW